MIYALDHIQLAMPKGEEQKARSFYQGILEIPEVPKPQNLLKRGGCWFEKGELKVHLGVENDFRPAQKAHPAFLVKNISLIIEQLEKENYEIKEDEPLEGYKRIYTSDPFGNRIEIMEKL